MKRCTQSHTTNKEKKQQHALGDMLMRVHEQNRGDPVNLNGKLSNCEKIVSNVCLD